VSRTLLGLVAAATLAVGAPADSAVAHRPGIAFTGRVPDDLRALATQTWRRFTDVVPARWRCIPPVRVTGAWKLADRGAYGPDTKLVTVRIPGTAPNLEASLIHEFAHHVEFTCPEQREIRARFLAAQGLAPGAPWFRGPTWEQTPSEQFAEATVTLLLGRTSHPLVGVTANAIAAIRAWGQGR
jgi:hypothetical protein